MPRMREAWVWVPPECGFFFGKSCLRSCVVLCCFFFFLSFWACEYSCMLETELDMLYGWFELSCLSSSIGWLKHVHVHVAVYIQHTMLSHLITVLYLHLETKVHVLYLTFRCHWSVWTLIYVTKGQISLAGKLITDCLGVCVVLCCIVEPLMPEIHPHIHCTCTHKHHMYMYINKCTFTMCTVYTLILETCTCTYTFKHTCCP